MFVFFIILAQRYIGNTPPLLSIKFCTIAEFQDFFARWLVHFHEFLQTNVFLTNTKSNPVDYAQSCFYD